MKIAFTGGGSAGHVTPNLALIESCLQQDMDIIYLGRANSIESELLATVPQVQFCAIRSERLRRYFSWKNFFVTPTYVLIGIIQAFFHLRSHKPNLVFSKGGFVTLPVVIAAWLNRIPVVIHESDGSLGLANRLSLPFTDLVCVAQERAKKNIKHRNIKHTGSPVRLEFLQAKPQQACQQFNLDPHKKLLLVFGGSQGSTHINQCVRESLHDLLTRYQVLHVCGAGGVDHELEHLQAEGYHQYEYIKEHFANLLAYAEWVIARAGANAIAELQAVKTPALLVPLSTQSSRGDQWMNAESFVAAGLGEMVSNEDFNRDQLLKKMNHIEQQIDQYKSSFETLAQSQGTQLLIHLIQSYQ